MHTHLPVVCQKDRQSCCLDRFEDVAAIRNLTPVPAAPIILESHRSGNLFTISFAALSGSGPWKVVGGPDLAVLVDDLTSRAIFTPNRTEPHLQQVQIDTTGLGPRYFVRLEEVPTP